jgi:hypothetical protein
MKYKLEYLLDDLNVEAHPGHSRTNEKTGGHFRK